MTFQPPAGDRAFFIGVASAVLVAGALSVSGRPTSLALATLGGLVGSGIGSGLSVDWPIVLTVVVAGLIGPAVALVLGYLLDPVLWRLAGNGEPCSIRTAHIATFAILSLVYSLNDGQRMLVVLVSALDGPGRAISVTPIRAVELGALFAIGAVIGTHRLARTITTHVFTARPPDAVSSEAAAALVSAGGALAGTPLSITQALAGGLVGAGASHGARRVRWHVASRLATAWVLTVPASMAIASLASAATRVRL